MKAIFKRNTMIYFKNPTTLFFSLIGSLIVFVLYILFLRASMLQQFKAIPGKGELLDLWMLGALLTVTGLTTSLTMLGQLINDKVNKKFMDFSLTPASLISLLCGYFLSACVVAFLMQLSAFAICSTYFSIKDGFFLSLEQILYSIAVMGISSLASSAFNLIICSLIQSEATLRAVTSILSAISGFITGAYIPIGSFSASVQTIIKSFPLSYSSSLFRRILMKPALAKLPDQTSSYLSQYLGLGYVWHNQLTSAFQDLLLLFASIFICLIILALLSKRLMHVSLSTQE